MSKTELYTVWGYIHTIKLFFRQSNDKHKIKDNWYFWWEGRGSRFTGTHGVLIMFSTPSWVKGSLRYIVSCHL